MTATLTICSALISLQMQGLSIPVDSLKKWDELAFGQIPQNAASIKNEAMHIQVDRSSSPLIYRLDVPFKVKGFRIKASWNGRLNIPGSLIQGDDGADDFVLKFGLVEAGETKLSWLQRRIAPKWVLRLHELASGAGGVKRVNFYSTTLQRNQLGKQRQHPLNEMLHEERIQYLSMPGPFELAKTFENPIETLGLWIASDGDNTGSEFELIIHSIELHI